MMKTKRVVHKAVLAAFILFWLGVIYVIIPAVVATVFAMMKK